VWPLVGGLAGLGLAVALRVSVAGPAAAGSAAAGVVFGTALLVLALACGVARPQLTPRQLLWGAAAACVLCAVPAARRVVAGGVSEPDGMLPLWATLVTYVAVTEELLLRGALFERALARFGGAVAVTVTSVAFALLHVPVYGWRVLPLDLAVGVCLGALRLYAGSVTAPAVAHTLADLAGWWLR
jgi:membrane protease YdiL (CAAX protease family)